LLPHSDVPVIDLEVGHAQQVAHDLRGRRLVDDGGLLVDVVPPHDEPLVPGPHHPDQAGTDAADVRPRLNHPVENRGTVADVGADVGLEGDVHGSGDVHRTLVRQPDVGRHLGARAVGTDQVLGADRVLVTREPVEDPDVDAAVVLGVREVLGRELRLRPPHRRVPGEDRLEIVLRDVDRQARRGELIVGLPRRAGSPRADPADLLPRDRGAEDRVTDQVVGCGVGQHLVLDAQVAEDLHGPLVGDVRPRRVGGPPVLGDHDVRDAERREEERGGGPCGAGTHDEHVGLDHRRVRELGLLLTVVEDGHRPVTSPRGRSHTGVSISSVRSQRADVHV
jgi:hypothetical protein